MKYIRTERLGFVLFGEWHNHDDMARKLCPNGVQEVLSAGFVSMDAEPECYGKSVSLDLSASARDTVDLRAQVEFKI
jgi:hypothetical protein